MGYRITQDNGYLDFLISLKKYCKRDIDLEYDELITNAIEFGMTLKDFWDNDINVFYSYQKAYINKVHRKAHITGAYNNIAFGIVLANAFKDKNSKDIQYPKEDVYNPFKREQKSNADNYLHKIDTKNNNNELYQLKRKLEERRNIKNG